MSKIKYDKNNRLHNIISKDGYMCEVLCYDEGDCDIFVYDKGVVVCGVSYEDFISKNFALTGVSLTSYKTTEKPMLGRLSKLDDDFKMKCVSIGEVRMQSYNLRAELVAVCGLSSKFVVRLTSRDFPDYTREVLSPYNVFSRGVMSFPEVKLMSEYERGDSLLKAIDRTGEIKFDKDGNKAVIKTFHKKTKFEVEYNGKLIQINDYDSWVTGTFFGDAKPQLGLRRSGARRNNSTFVESEKSKEKKEQIKKEVKAEKEKVYDEVTGSEEELNHKFVGIKGRACNGMTMVIARYKNYTNLDVRFEDGSVAYNKDLYSFLRGKIANPRIKRGIKYDEDWCEDSSYKRLEGVDLNTELFNPRLMLTLDTRIKLNGLKCFTIADVMNYDKNDLISKLSKVQYKEVNSLKIVMRIATEESESASI